MPRPPALGEFEHMVLLAVLRLDDAQPPAVLGEIAARTGSPASRGSIYVTLDRLEDKGLLRSTFVAGPSDRGGHPRRRLQLTPAGLRVLRQCREALMNMWQGVEERLRRA